MPAEFELSPLILDVRSASVLKPNEIDARLATFFSTAPSGGAKGILAFANDQSWNILNRARALGNPFEVYPVVPNMGQYVRDVGHYGPVRAGWKNAKSAGLLTLSATALAGASRWKKILGNDFQTLLNLVSQFEIHQFRRFKPRVIFLHPQMTDMALAFNNRALASDFVELVENRWKAKAGFATNNLQACQVKLVSWGFSKSPILAPFNPAGFVMKPTRADCEALARQANVFLIADRIRVADGSFAEAFRYLKGFPAIHSRVVDLQEMNEDCVNAYRESSV